MEYYLFFKIHNLALCEAAQQELESLGLSQCCLIEDLEEGSATISGLAESVLSPRLSERLDTPQIDWADQWNLDEGELFHLDLEPYKENIEPLKLYPGPGFGDCSHPTTRLALKLMASHVSGKNVVDIGCGSGILSLAALKLGALKCEALDICPEALFHTKRNAELNGLEEKLYLSERLQGVPQEPILVLINMIASEQEIAWNSNSLIHTLPLTIISAGILKSDRQTYLDFVSKNWGWQLQGEESEGEWCAFLFQN